MLFEYSAVPIFATLNLPLQYWESAHVPRVFFTSFHNLAPHDLVVLQVASPLAFPEHLQIQEVLAYLIDQAGEPFLAAQELGYLLVEQIQVEIEFLAQVQ